MSNLGEIGLAINIVEMYAPTFYANNTQPILGVLMKHQDFRESLIGLGRYMEDNSDMDAQCVSLDIVHDIAGLHNEERMFLPRIDSFKDYK